MKCAVLNGTKQLAYPKPYARPGEAVEIADLFSRRFAYDAFVMPHAIPAGELPYRVTKDDYLARFPNLRFVLLFADIDGHGLAPDTLSAWKAAESARARSFLELYPGLLYETSRGLRLVWRTDLPFNEYAHLARAFYERMTEFGFSQIQRGVSDVGVDRTACSFGRHMRLPFVVRDGERQEPKIEGSLEFLKFDAGVAPAARKPRPRPRALANAGISLTSNDPNIRRALELGVAAPMHGMKFAVVCPGGHTEPLSSKTVIVPEGYLVCQSARCRHLRYGDWSRTIPFDLVSLEEGERIIEAGLRKGGIGQVLSVLDVPCGVGKSHIARRLLPAGEILEGTQTVLLSPTNALATQHREACGAEQHAGVAAEIPGRDLCVQPKVVAKLHELGLSSKYACQTCPNREGCKVAEPIGDRAKGMVSTHAMLHRFDEGKHLVIIDEMPAVTESFEIDLKAIPEAMKACKRDWALGIGAWASALCSGRVDENARTQALFQSETPETAKIPTYGEHFDGERMQKTFAPIQTARDVRRAAHPSSRIVFADGKARVTRLSAPMAYLQERGGSLLAAGASETLLRAVRPDLEISHLYVQDPVSIERVLVKTSDASTRKLLADPARLGRIVSAAKARAAGRPALFMCAKALEPSIRAAGVEVATFGALRGLDAWKDREVFVTIGDHFDNIGAVDAEAEFLNVDAWALSRERVEIELGQAHGRARDPRRSTPCSHFHYGEVWPFGWGPMRASVEF
jgi:hypothetical protein